MFHEPGVNVCKLVIPNVNKNDVTEGAGKVGKILKYCHQRGVVWGLGGGGKKKQRGSHPTKNLKKH